MVSYALQIDADIEHSVVSQHSFTSQIFDPNGSILRQKCFTRGKEFSFYYSFSPDGFLHVETSGKSCDKGAS